MSLNKNYHYGVKGTVNNIGGVSLGRNGYVQQVPSNHQQATAAKLTSKPTLHAGTWNERTLFMAGQFENVKVQMDRLNIDILGIRKTRWAGN